MSILSVEVPRAFEPLLASRRYKGAHGGRGGAKSHFFAEQLVLHCYAGVRRAVCIREVQNSIRESVRQLIIDKIRRLGLGAFFTV
ncbi:MAG: phage terminase large subunit, partial [Parvibaculaceae bacterium]